MVRAAAHHEIAPCVCGTVSAEVAISRDAGEMAVRLRFDEAVQVVRLLDTTWAP